jgi:hypothetical protein
LRKLEESAKSIAGGKLFDRADIAVDNEVEASPLHSTAWPAGWRMR